MSTPEQRLCRLAQEAADAGDPMLTLETLVQLRHELEVFTHEHVARGLRAGRSFGDIARALGISRQAAHRRYRHLSPAQGPRVTATDQARRVLTVAREEALSTNAAALGSEHVLIAVLRCGGEAAEALVSEGASLEATRARERALVAQRGGPSAFAASPAGVRGVLAEATKRTMARGGRWLDANALLLAALADPEGGARRVLAALGVDANAVRGRLAEEPGARNPSGLVANGRQRRNGA